MALARGMKVKVRLRKAHWTKQQPDYADEMLCFANAVTRISALPGGPLVRLEIDNGKFAWHRDWLTEVPEDTNTNTSADLPLHDSGVDESLKEFTKGELIRLSESLIEDYEEVVSKLKQLIKVPSPTAVVLTPSIEIIYSKGLEDKTKIKGREDHKGDTTEKTVVYFNGEEVFVEKPDKIEMQRGDYVLINGETKQIISKLGPSNGIGVIATALTDEKNGVVEIEHGQSGICTVYAGAFDVKEGDRIVIHPKAPIVVGNLGSPVKKKENIKKISWADVGGLGEAKTDMIEIIELPHKHPEVFKKYGKPLPKGALLEGPPGCGKTLLANAAVTALAEVTNGKGIDTAFIYIKGPEVLSKWVGEAESTIRGLFIRAKAHKDKHGYPAVIFIDEADALLTCRGRTRSSDVNLTIIPQFLSEMDGLDESSAIVLLATNRPENLDPAVIREGRIDKKIHIGRPDQKASMEIFKIHMANKPLSKEVDKDALIKESVETVFSENLALYDISFKDGGYYQFNLSDLLSGAMIASITEQAASFAIRRDLMNKKSEPGITREDVMTAIQKTYEQNINIDHRSDLERIVFEYGEVQEIKKRSIKKMKESSREKIESLLA